MRREYTVSRGWRAFIVSVLRPSLFLLMKRDWHGRENVPREGGVILAVNHVTVIDPLTLSHFVYKADRWPAFLAKESVFKVPLIGPLLRAVGQIPVARSGIDAARSLQGAEDALEQSASLIIYPEGTCTRDPDLWPMVAKTGVARLALTTGKPVIPIAHFGAHRILAYRSKRFRPFPRKTVHVRAGQPVDLSAYQGLPLTAATLQAATVDVMAAITELLAQIRDEQPPAEPYDPRKARAARRDDDGTDTDADRRHSA